MNILLVAVNSSYTHSNLAVRSLAINSKYTINIYETNINTNINISFNEIINKNCDVIGFSCYIWNIEYIKKLACDIKKAFPDIKIIFGGPEVSFNPQDYINVCDYVICGEGEEVIDELLDSLPNPKAIKGVYSQMFKDNTYRYIENLDKIQIECENLKDKIAYYESSRGCPYSCAYCLSGSMAGGVRFKSIECVKKDIDILIKSGAKIIKFVDRTFNANEKRAIEILEYIKTNTQNVKFHFEFGIDIISEELMNTLLNFEKDKIQIEGGVQSTNEDTLCSVVRKTNIEKLKNNAQKIISNGNIHVHLDLIAGLPKEDYNSFKQSFNDVYGLHPHKLQLGFLKLLKGSRLNFEYEKFGIVCREYSPYEVIKTDCITVQEIILLKHIDFIIDKYKNTARFYHTFNYLDNCSSDYFNTFLKIAEYFYENGLMTRPLSVKDQFKFFYECLQSIQINKDFSDYLELDYISSGVKGIAPDFVKSDNKIKEYIHCAKEKRLVTPHQIRNAVFYLSNIHPQNYTKGKWFVMCEPYVKDVITNAAKITVLNLKI